VPDSVEHGCLISFIHNTGAFCMPVPCIFHFIA